MDLEKYERIKKETEAKEAPNEIPEYLKTLTIVEAVKLPEFKESLNEVMSKAQSFRYDFMRSLNKIRVKNDVMQRLDDMDEWNIDAVTRIYLGCLDKSLDTSRYSMRTRQFITRVGDMALSRMINKLKEKQNEKAI